MSSPQDELVLLERVFLRFGSAETDEQLENVLAKFLPPVLLKLSSPQEGVRKKVMELLVHISKRVKSRPQVQLPVDALLMQYQDPSATAFVINFTIIYIKLGFPRLDENKQVELLPCLLNCLEGRPQLHQDSLLLLMMSVLPHLKIPQDPQKSKCLLGLNEKPAIARLVSDFALDVILLPYGMAKVDTSLKRPSSQDESNSTPPPPGMSEVSFKRVMGEQPMPPDQLEKVKLALVKFLSSGVYPEIEILPHLIVASSDTRHSVASTADYEIKKISGSIDWNDSHMIMKLFTLFLGEPTNKNQKQPVRPEHRRTPTNTRIRLKIFPCLLKSPEAATRLPFVLQVVFESLYGHATNGKLRIMAVQFVESVCKNCSESTLLPFGSVLLSGLMKLIPDSKEQEPKLQNMTYVAIGRLCQKLPQLIAKDLSVLQNLFDVLGKENQDTRMAIQESLSLMAKSISTLDDSVKGLVEALIKASIESTEPQVRQMALHYATTVFPSNHVPSRYVVMIAAGDVKDEIRSDALKALHATRGSRHLFEDDPSKNKCPPFPELISYLYNEAEYRKNSTFKYVTGNTVLPFNPATYFEMIRYCRHCLAVSAEVSNELLMAESLQEQAPTIALYVRKLLNMGESNGKSPVIIYTSMIRQLLTAYVEPLLVYYLLEVTAIVPDLVAKQLLEDLQLIKNLMSSSREEVRENAAQLLAVLLVSAFDDNMVNENAVELIKISKDKNPEMQHGALLTLGYVIGRKLYNMKKIGKLSPSESDLTLRESVLLLSSFLTNPQASLQIAACVALGEIARNGPLPLPETVDEETTDIPVSKEKVISMLADIIKSSKASPKVREKAAQTLGYLCVGDAQFKFAQKVISQLLEAMFEITDVDLHFTLGEAVCNAALGPGSFAAQDPWTENKSDINLARHGGRENEVQWLLSEILGRYILHTKPSVRQAAAICVLSLLKHCGHLQSVMDNMSQIQSALVSLLADSNDLTQDVASKGLGLLYERGTEDEKKQLLGILVDTLTSGRRPNITVTADTQVFQEGELGHHPDGGNLTTYKELCALATDLNQPDLVYKFMNLANYNATWNSKKGAAFGFGSIAQQAGEQLEVLLPSIVPRLYRYQYDPIPSIRASFVTIWRAVVRDPAKTVDKYVREILMDLMENLTNPQWRVRESCCLGLCDLLQGRQLSDVLEFLPELWKKCFRVADDIKETVRKAAESALKVLSKVSVKTCDSSSGKVGQQALTLILPVLVKDGLSNPVAKVKQLSLATIIEISKSAGHLLKPHLQLLMISLLESLSGMESQTMNYLSVRLETDSAVQEKLDSARIAVMKSSPMMETVNRCVQYVDEEVLVELVPRLVELIRSSVGLGTKSGCANLVISLTYHCPTSLQPHAGKLLSAFMNGLGDRNANIRKSYATAIGYLAKVAKDTSVERLINKISIWYMEKEEDSVRTSCAQILQTLARHGPDVLRDHAAQVLPLAFFAMHTKTEKVESSNSSSQSPWEDIWMEFTPGTEAGVRLYLDEIMTLVRKGLESQSWALKQQAAIVITALATKAGSCIDADRVILLLDVLLTGLAGRTWTGKETLLEALSSICVHCKSALLKANEENQDKEIIKKVIETVLRECKKENWIYRTEAIKCLGEILYQMKEDRFSELFELLHPLLVRDRNSISPDDDEGDESSRSDAQLNFQSTAYEALGKAWPDTNQTQEKYLSQFSDLLNSRYPLSTWKVQLSIMRALTHLITRLKQIEVFQTITEEQQEEVLMVLNRVTITTVQALGTKYSSVRDEGFTVLNTLVERLKACANSRLTQRVTTSQVRAILASLQKDGNPQIQDKAQQILKAIIELES